MITDDLCQIIEIVPESTHLLIRILLFNHHHNTGHCDDVNHLHIIDILIKGASKLQ